MDPCPLAGGDDRTGLAMSEAGHRRFRRSGDEQCGELLASTNYSLQPTAGESALAWAQALLSVVFFD